MPDHAKQPARHGRTVQSVCGALSAGAATGSTAYAAGAHDTTGLIVTAAAGVVTTALTVIVPQLFWWRAQNPLRPLRWWHRRGRLTDVTGKQLLDLQREASTRTVRARTTVDAHHAPNGEDTTQAQDY